MTRSVPSAAVFLPHNVDPAWLGRDAADALLLYAIQNEAKFQPATVRRNDKTIVNTEKRRSLTWGALGPFDGLIRDRANALAAPLSALFGNGGFKPAAIKLEIVAYGDGDFLTAHVDTHTQEHAATYPRQISMVYYLRHEPPRFTGGDLRYYALAQKSFIDIEPRHDLLFAFPSIALHAVNPVACPGNAFADRRFSVNIWLDG